MNRLTIVVMSTLLIHSLLSAADIVKDAVGCEFHTAQGCMNIFPHPEITNILPSRHKPCQRGFVCFFDEHNRYIHTERREICSPDNLRSRIGKLPRIAYAQRIEQDQGYIDLFDKLGNRVATYSGGAFIRNATIGIDPAPLHLRSYVANPEILACVPRRYTKQTYSIKSKVVTGAVIVATIAAGVLLYKKLKAKKELEKPGAALGIQ